MTLIEKLEQEAEQQQGYPNEYALQLAYKYGWVTNALQYRVNELENAFKDLEKTVKQRIK